MLLCASLLPGAGCAGHAPLASLSPAVVSADSGTDEVTGSRLRLALTIDPDTVRSGDRVVLTLTASCPEGPSLTLHFSTSQRFDFSLETAAGEPVWLWSEGRFFLQVLGEETLGPKRPELVFRASLAEPPAPGSYVVRATVTSIPPLSVSRSLVVRD